MGFLRTIGWGFAGGAAGFLIGAIGASVVAAMMRMPAREGGPGFFAIGIGFFAGFAGMIAGMVYAQYTSGTPLRSITLGFAVIVLLIAGSICAYRYWYVTRSQAYFTRMHGSIPLLFEIRTVPGQRVQAATLEGISGTLEGDGELLAGSVRLYRVTSERNLELRLVDGTTQTFPIALPVNPSRASGRPWSEWVTGSGGSALRYRVQ
jgi:hypothetical protein